MWDFSFVSRKQGTEFCNMLRFREGVASGKHVAQTSQRRVMKKLTERRSNKMADSSIRMSVQFFCLTLLRKFQTHGGSSREKHFILALESANPSPHRTPFYLSAGEVSK